MRITLNVILRAVFGADGAELDRLRQIMPGWVTLGSRLATLPQPPAGARASSGRGGRFAAGAARVRRASSPR